MSWIGLIIVSPTWGLVSTQLFFMAWLGLINGIIGIVGFFAGRVERKKTIIGIGVGFGSAVLYSLLLRAGFWLLVDILHFGHSTGENTVYWIFAALSALYVLIQIPNRIRKSWRNMMVPGSLEADIFTRKISA